MKTAELIHQRVEDLPEAAHLALLEYIEFLLHKYRMESSKDSEVEFLTQDLILKRYERYRQDTAQLSQSLDSFESKLKAKYGWNE
jgi:hypothetical protein